MHGRIKLRFFFCSRAYFVGGDNADVAAPLAIAHAMHKRNCNH